MLRQKLAQAPKTKLNQTLRSWLDVLMCGADELKETIQGLSDKNPFVDIQTNFKQSKKSYFRQISKNTINDNSELYAIDVPSLYDVLLSQISPPLFPTLKSQNIAFKIIECIDDEGYFEYDDDVLSGFDVADIERVRARFAYLEPSGVGACSVNECMKFQLVELDLDDDLQKTCEILIDNLDTISNYKHLKLYSSAVAIIKKLKNPPAIEYLHSSTNVTPDICINTDDGIKVSINDEVYPLVVIDTEGIDERMEFVASHVKSAKELVDALELRKATLYKIGLMIVEYQYDYFMGGDIKPMRLKDIADELGRSASTISRAIANKYIDTPRGTIAIKSFFSTALDDEISNAAIKSYVSELVKNENRAKPLSDNQILELIRLKFGVNMVRRTITKYRKSLNIASSSERKRIYAIA